MFRWHRDLGVPGGPIGARSYLHVGRATGTAKYPNYLTESLRRRKFLLCAMYGRRPRCKRNLTLPRWSGAVMYSAYCCSRFGRWP